MDWSRYAVGGAAARPDSFTGLKPDFASSVYRMVQDAHAAGVPLQITSAYRSPEVQAQLYQGALKKYGSPQAARKWVAPPGRSQHNFGTAVDFAVNGSLIRDADSPAAQWINANAANYGLDVPMSWEPWQVEMAGARGQSAPTGGGSDDTILGGLSIRPKQADTLETPTEAPMQPDKATGILGSLFPDMTGDRQDRIAMALSGLSMHPNRAVMQMAQQRMGDRREDKKEAQALNKTLAFFKNRPNAELYAGAIAAGANPGQVINSYVKAQQDLNDPSVQSSQMLPDQSGTVLTMRDGSLKVVTAGGDTLLGNDAMEFVRKSQETAVGYEREKYGARREGTLGANADFGREANRELAAGTEEGKNEVERASAASSIISKAESSIALINSIMSDPALEGITGMLQGRLPPMTQAGTNLNVKIKQLQGKAFLEAFESLKGGGAITEREGQAAQNAMARLDRAQSTNEYLSALSELRGIMQQAATRAGAADFNPQPQDGGWTEINGVKIRVKK